MAHDEAKKLDPNYAEAWNNKVNLLAIQGKYDESIKCLDEVIKINPNFAQDYCVKGVTLESLGRTTEANAAFSKAKELGYTG